jgi:hypothetical protein
MKGGNCLVSSPVPGISTLIISAPISLRVMLQNGPAKTLLRSRTLSPFKGGLFFSIVICGSIEVSLLEFTQYSRGKIDSFFKYHRYKAHTILGGNEK